MKLQRREKILAGLSLGLVGLLGLYFLFFAGDGRSDEQLNDDLKKLAADVAEKRNYLQAASRDRKRLDDWQTCALPSDPVLARSMYQNWLVGMAKRANLHEVKLGSTDQSHRDQFTRISLKLGARATLSDFLDFLYRFYSIGYLHQIRRMDIKPIRGSRDLDLNIAIEALSLPTAKSKDRLPDNIPKEDWHGLALTKLSDYQDPIVSRNFFSVYVPPPPIDKPPLVDKPKPPTPPQLPPVNLAEHAYVTGFIEVDDAPQVWLQDRIAGKPWKLGTGESFTVGKKKGTVETIRPEGEVIVDFDGHRRLLRLGDTLYGGEEISDATPNRPMKTTIPPNP